LKGQIVNNEKPVNPLAIASLVLSLSPLLLIGLGWGSLAAIVAALLARKQILESLGEEGGESLARAGLIIGIVGLVLSVVICCILALVAAIPIIETMS
jgi:hypothetical protein